MHIGTNSKDWPKETTDKGFTIKPDLTKIPTGKMDFDVMLWVLAAWDKLNRASEVAQQPNEGEAPNLLT